MQGSFAALCLSLSLGYVVCVVAKKQTGVLKSLGYTIGISTIVLALGTALIASYLKPCPCMGMWKKCMKGGKMAMKCPMAVKSPTMK